MAIKRGPDIVKDGLEFAIDAAAPRSYPGSGTSVYDLTKNQTATTLSGTTVSNGHFSLAGQGETDGNPLGDYIQIPNSGITQVQTHDAGIAYEIWVNPNVDSRRSLFFGSGTIRHVELYCGSSGGSVRTEAALQNGYSFGASAPTGGWPKDTWSMLNIVWDPDGATRAVKWYKNGTLFHTHANFYSGTGGTSEDFYFTEIGRATGTSAYLYARSWSGLLNGFKVYGRTLTADEVAQNYHAQKTRYGL